jgi:hypothetical protein
VQRPDKRGRKESLDRWKADQRAAARAKLPLPEAQMKALFDALDLALAREKCDHTLRFVRRWLTEQELAIDAVEKWLYENGGYCDCTALFNSEERGRDAMHDVDWG